PLGRRRRARGVLEESKIVRRGGARRGGSAAERPGSDLLRRQPAGRRQAGDLRREGRPAGGDVGGGEREARAGVGDDRAQAGDRAMGAGGGGPPVGGGRPRRGG